MSEPAFPPHVSAALDRLTVPPLPQGFGERLAARVAAGDLPADAGTGLPAPPSRRLRFSSTPGWRRSSRIVATVAAFGLATATAAASGFFGEPVYVPVVSDALAKAKLVELPEAGRAKARPVPAALTDTPVQTEAPVTATGREAVRNLYQRLRADPEYRVLPRPQRLAVARQEIRSMLQSGEVTLPELRAALAERRTVMHAAIAKGIQREIMRREWRERTGGPLPLQPREAGLVAAQSQRQIDPEKTEALRQAYQALPADQQARLRELRQQLRTAPLAERRAIRREIRDILQPASPAADENVGAASEGNPEVVR